MARRRKDDLKFSELLALPWWISAVLAVFGFVFFQWIFPAIASSNPFLKATSLAFRPFGYGVGIFFAAIAVISLLKQLSLPAFARKSAWSKAGEPTYTPSVPGPGRVLKTWEEMSAQNREPTPKPTTWSLELLRLIEWKRFEELAAAFYRELGLRSETIRCGADGGIDAKLFKGDDKEPTAIVQCKAWNARPVGVAPVRELLGVMTHQKVPEGIFLSTGEFTNEAMEYEKTNPIHLINGPILLGMIETLPVEAQQRLLAVATEGEFTTPTCPSCGIKMVWRNSDRKDLWGCRNYPRCKSKLFTKMEGA
jgi:restriction system protein